MNRLSGIVILVAGFLLSTSCGTNTKSQDVSKQAVSGDPWFRAARTADFTILKGMLAAGKKIDEASSSGTTGLMIAARSGNLETVKWFLENGAAASTRDRDEQSALVYALTGLAQGLKLGQIVDSLILAGADPFYVDKLGFQPIQQMIDLELDAEIRRLKFTDKKPCDLVPTRPGEVSLSRGARRIGNIPLAEFLESQGCW